MRLGWKIPIMDIFCGWHLAWIMASRWAILSIFLKVPRLICYKQTPDLWTILPTIDLWPQQASFKRFNNGIHLQASVQLQNKAPAVPLYIYIYICIYIYMYFTYPPPPKKKKKNLHFPTSSYSKGAVWTDWWFCKRINSLFNHELPFCDWWSWRFPHLRSTIVAPSDWSSRHHSTKLFSLLLLATLVLLVNSMECIDRTHREPCNGPWSN